MMCELKNYILLLFYYVFHINCEFKQKKKETDGRTNIGQALSHETPDGRRDEFILFYFITAVSNISERGNQLVMTRLFL